MSVALLLPPLCIAALFLFLPFFPPERFFTLAVTPGWRTSPQARHIQRLYWLAVIVGFLAMGYNEKRGHWPLMKRRSSMGPAVERESFSSTSTPPEKHAQPESKVSEITA